MANFLFSIFKQDKGKGTTLFPFISHHPATAGWDGNNGTFWAQKFGFLLFLIGDNFYSLDPIRKPPFLRG